MQIKKQWIVLLILVLAILPLAACGSSEGGDGHGEEPYTLEEGPNGFNLVKLTDKAAERLDIQSVAIAEEDVDGETKLVVPYASLIYGNNGETWAYIRNPGADSLTFTRVELDVDHIDGGRVILSDGPDIGSHVVTVGVAELYGADTGVGK